VTEVVGQTGGFDDIGIKPQPIGKFSANLSHFQRVGETVPRKIETRRGREDLGFSR
jgi:hypothetical protein